MCCLFALLVVLGPRAVVLFWWLTDQARWAIVFNDQVLIPILGFLFLPWTTLAYVLVWSVGGMDGWAWLFVAIAFGTDIVSYGGGAYTNRERLPGNRWAA